MGDFIIDADPFNPTGVPATREQVAQMVADGILAEEQVQQLVPEQQPEVTP